MADENRPEGEAPPEPTPPTSDTPAEPAVKPVSPPEATAAAEKPAAPAGETPAAKAEATLPAEKPAAAAKPPPPKKAPPVMETEAWEGPIATGLKERFGESVKECLSYRGQDFVVAELSAAASILEHLKSEEGFDYLVDITAVDYPEREGKRFDLVWILYSFRQNVRVRVKAEAGDGEKPATATGLYSTANWIEREVFDMFGIEFENHPNLTRILLPDGWEGHPLRKDYSIIKQDEAWVRENLQIESGQ